MRLFRSGYISALSVSGCGAALDARHDNGALFWDEVVDDTIVANPTAPTEGFPLETSNITCVGVILHLTERHRHALAVSERKFSELLS
jgi:hypothetical protein